MTSNRRFRRIYGMAAGLALMASVSLPAHADFLDGVRRTFTTDMPHFFQDDIPCAFGGQPTSHTKTSCKASAPAKDASGKAGSPAAVSSGRAKETRPPARPAAGSAEQASGR